MNEDLSVSVAEPTMDTVITRPSWLPLEFNVTVVSPKVCNDHCNYCQFRIAIDIAVVAVLCIVGLIGNTLSVLVLRVDNTKKTVSFLLQALAIGDNMYLISCFFIQTIKAMCDCTTWINHGVSQVMTQMEIYMWPCASIAQTFTIWVVVLVTLDRYVAICRPFHTKRLCTPSRAKKAVGLIAVLAILYNIPRFFEKQPYQYPDFCSQMMRCIAVSSTFRRNKLYFIIYKTGMYFFFRVTVPMSILACVNMKLILTLREAQKKRQRFQTELQQQQKKDNVTVVLVVVVTVFIVCQLPDFILRAAVTLKYYSHLTFSTRYYNTLTNMLVTVNSSINCLIYSLTGKRFRVILRHLVCRSLYQLEAANNSSLRKQSTTSYRRSFSKPQSTSLRKESCQSNYMDCDTMCLKDDNLDLKETSC